MIGFTLVSERFQLFYSIAEAGSKGIQFPAESMPGGVLAAALVATLPRDGKEHLVAVALDAHYRPLAWHVVATGSVDNCPLFPRDVYSWALTVPRTRFVGIAHNHPSGLTTPSGQDEQGSAVVAEAGKIIGLDLAWSLVVTHENETWAEVKFQGKAKRKSGGDDANTKRPEADGDEDADSEGEAKGEKADKGDKGESDGDEADKGEADGDEGYASRDDLAAALKALLGGRIKA